MERGIWNWDNIPFSQLRITEYSRTTNQLLKDVILMRLYCFNNIIIINIKRNA